MIFGVPGRVEARGKSDLSGRQMVVSGSGYLTGIFKRPRTFRGILVISVDEFENNNRYLCLTDTVLFGNNVGYLNRGVGFINNRSIRIINRKTGQATIVAGKNK